MTFWELLCLAAATLLLAAAVPVSAFFTALLTAYAVRLGRWKFERDHQHDERVNRNGKQQGKA